MFCRVAMVVAVRQASHSAFNPPLFKFRHRPTTSDQDGSVAVITAPVSQRERETQQPDKHRKRSPGKWEQKNDKSSGEPQFRHRKSWPTSEDSNTGDKDKSSPERPWKIKSFGTQYTKKTGTKFTTKSPSQSVEDTLARMGIEAKGEIIFGIFPVLLALQARRRTVHQVMYKSGVGVISDKLQNILTIAEEQQVPVKSLKPSQFKRIFQGDQVHQGVCCDVSPLLFVTIDEDHPEQQAYDGQGRCEAEQISEEGRKKHKGIRDIHEATGRNEQVEEEQERYQAEERKQQEDEQENHKEEERKQEGEEEKSHQTEEERKQQGEQQRRRQTQEKRKRKKEGELQSHQAVGERKQKLWLYLDQIQDPMNFGSVLRSAYFMGVDRVLTSETFSTRITSTVSKASAGVAEVFPVHQVRDPIRLVSSLSQTGWELVSSASMSSDSCDGGASLIDVNTFHPKGNVLLIVGNEGKGISPELQRMCHTILTITPGRSLHPHLQCLNVSVATALLLHGLCHRLSPCRP